jgi:hypothetical protein
VIGFFYADYCFPAQKQGLKRKMTTSSSSTTPKLKKVKVLTRRRRPHLLERMVVVLGTEKIEIAEQAEATSLASETIPAVIVEAEREIGLTISYK